MIDPKTEADDAIGQSVEPGEKSGALRQSLTGTDGGSDTRAGSLRGGTATGSDDDPDAEAVNKAMASQGLAMRDTQSAKT
jgi:hypothetical protein